MKGFTLIEAMIVIAIIGIIMAVFVPACKGNLDKQHTEFRENSDCICR